MNDSFNTGLGTGSNYNLNFETLIQTNVSTAPQGPAKIRDTTAVSGSSDNPFTFTLPHQPHLVPPVMDNIDPDGMMQLEDVLKNYIGDVLTSASKLPDVYKEFLETTEKQLSQMSSEDIASLKTGLPKEQVIDMIRMAIFNADADVPESIKEAANKIRGESSKITGQAPDAIIRLINKQTAELLYTSLLKEELSGLGLSPEQVQQLLAADQMPEFVEQLSPEMQKMLAEAQAKAIKGVQEEVGVSASWRPASSREGFELGVANAFEKEVGDKLYDKFISGKLSKAEYNDIRTMLYIPDANPPNAEKLSGLLTSIQTEAKASVQKEWGFPSSYEINISSEDYTAILTGTFYATAKKAIGSQTPPLSSADQAALTAALSSPALKEALPANLKEILNSIETAATAKVIKQYGLPATWVPDAQLLVNAPGLDTPKLQFGLNVLAMGIDLVNKLKQLAGEPKATGQTQGTGGTQGAGETSAADGTQGASLPLKNKVLNYLKVVSNALAALQEILFAASITQTNISKMLARIEQDAQMGKLATEKKNIEDTKAKIAKEASLGPFKWIIMIIMILLVVFTAGALGVILGPIIIGAAVGMGVNAVVRAAVKGNMNDVDMFKAMAETLGDFGRAMGSKAFGKFLAALVTVIMCVACPWVLIFDLSFGGGSTVTVFLEGIGIPPDIAGYLAMAIQVIAMVIMMVISVFFAPELIPAQVGLMVATITEQISAMIPKIVMVVLQVIMDVIEAVQKFVSNIVNTVLKFIKETMKAIKDMIMKAFVGTEKAASQVEAATAKLAKIQQKLLQATEKLEALKNADVKDASKIKEAAKAVEKLENAERKAMGNVKMAKEALSQAEDMANTLKELGKKVEEAAQKVLDATDDVQRQQAKEQLKAAKQELKQAETQAIKQAEQKTVQQIKDLIKSVADLTEDQKTAISKVKDAEAAVEKAEDALQQARQAKDLIKEADALTELADARAALNEAKSASDDIALQLAKASKELDEVNEAAMRPLERMATAAEMVNDVVNNSVQINNNILQAQIARLKGELEAYLADVELFIKMIQNLIAKFQQSLQDLMKAISDLGSVMHESWVKQSQSMTTLAQAM